MALDNFRKTSMRIDKANQRFLDYQNAKAGDVNGRELLVQITNNGVVEDQTGTTLKLNWQHENGNQDSTNFKVVDIKTGKYSLYYPKEMLYKGTVDASVEINSNGQITHTMNFKIIVHGDVFDGEAGTVNGVFISLADVNKKLDDREKEYVELKERQTTVETQFNSIQQELTDTDINSAPEIIAARGGEPTLSDRLDKEQQEVTAQLVQTSTRTEQYQGDLVELLLKNSTLKNKIAVRYVSPDTLDVSVFYKENEATVYTFKPDNNGWYRLFGAVTRQMSVFPQKETKNRDSITGTWSQNNPNHYATSVGSTFTADFFGTGCYLQTYANDQGGIWEIVVDGVYSKTISTWSATAQNPKVHHLFENLPEGNHTMVGTFKGDDPNHVPSEGAGTSRGWLRYGTLVTDSGVGIYFTKIAQGAGLVTAFEATSRKEFAFLCAPTEISAQRVWVPEHDGSSVLRNITTKIYFGEREVNLSSESPFYQIYDSVKIQSTFEAYNPNDDTNPMFTGRIEQKIDGEGVHVTSHFDFLRDTYISSGYTAMMMIAKGSTRNNAVVDSFGKRHLIDYYNTGEIDTYIDDKPFSIMHFVNPDTLPSDILTGLTDHARDTVQAMKLNNYMTTMRFGKENVGGVFVRSRTDGDRKTYYQAFENHTAVAGESLDFSVTYFVGKIADASKILPNT